MFRKLSPVLAISIACGFGSGVAHADQPAPAASSATPLSAIHVKASSDPDTAAIGSVDGASLHASPVSVQLVDSIELRDRQPHSLADVLRTDASVNASYAPVGYYQNFAIRGFPLDLASGYRRNGLSIAGEQRIDFQDLQRVAVLAGLPGIQAGVVSPGGLVNLVSKRPADVRRITLGTDSHGSRRVGLDLGTWLTPQFGIRFNTAWHDLHSFADHADGRSNSYALAVDWAPTDKLILHLDSNYHASAQNSVSGYQLLGGFQVPQDAHNDWMLGWQPWQAPTVIHSLNNSARLDWQFAHGWTLQLAAGNSHSRIDDAVAYAYGCGYQPACGPGAAPGGYFAPNGGYDIYDFRSPDEKRRNSEARAKLIGNFSTGALRHTVTLGWDALRRSVDARPWVYDYVGSANIHHRHAPTYPPSPATSGPRVRQLTSWQHSLLAQDRLQFGAHWQLLAGARLLRVDESEWDDQHRPQRHSRFDKALPQAAALWMPDDAWTVYASYGKSLALGEQAPTGTSNAGTLLPPVIARQWELGAKWQGRDQRFTLAAFRIRRPYQFALPDASAAGRTFVQRGAQQHRGLSFDYHGRLTPWLGLDASAMWLRARIEDTGLARYEGHQAVNVPKWQFDTTLDYHPMGMHAWHLLATWRHASPRSARLDGRAHTQGYNVFDAGLRYPMQLGGQNLVWRIMASNLFNTFYWRDTSGDYLFPGQPRQIRVSVSWSL